MHIIITCVYIATYLHGDFSSLTYVYTALYTIVYILIPVCGKGILRSESLYADEIFVRIYLISHIDRLFVSMNNFKM